MSGPLAISKTLSPNDVGQTGTHQAGILIPKRGGILEFFPSLATRELNPRRSIRFIDGVGKEWPFMFIYYNNRFVGGTRDEYRLTHMTEFMRSHDLRPGDTLVLTRADGLYRISCRKAGAGALQVRDAVLRLGTRWRVVSI